MIARWFRKITACNLACQVIRSAIHVAAITVFIGAVLAEGRRGVPPALLERALDFSGLGIASTVPQQAGDVSGPGLENLSNSTSAAAIEALDHFPKIVALSDDTIIIYRTENDLQPDATPRAITAWFVDVATQKVLRTQHWTSEAKEFASSEGQILATSQGGYVIMASRQLLGYDATGKLVSKKALSKGHWYMRSIANGTIILLRHSVPGDDATDYTWLEAGSLQQIGKSFTDTDPRMHLALRDGISSGLLAGKDGKLMLVNNDGTEKTLGIVPQKANGLKVTGDKGREFGIATSMGGLSVISFDSGKTLWSKMAPRFGNGELRVDGTRCLDASGDFAVAVTAGRHSREFDGVALSSGFNLLVYNVASPEPRSYLSLAYEGGCSFSPSGRSLFVIGQNRDGVSKKDKLALLVYGFR